MYEVYSFRNTLFQNWMARLCGVVQCGQSAELGNHIYMNISYLFHAIVMLVQQVTVFYVKAIVNKTFFTCILREYVLIICKSPASRISCLII